MKKFLVSASLLLATFAIGQNIKFTENELYPEGVAYSHKAKSFYVSSLHYGKIGKVDWTGKYSTFIDDKESISAIGIAADEKRNLLYVAISDPGVSVKTTAAMKIAKIGAYDLTTGKRKFITDLAILNTTGGGNFANDMAFDNAGNIYLNNSASPIIYKIDQIGKAEVFVTSDDWKKEGFNLNGIVCNQKDNYLLVCQSNTGEIYKVDIKTKKISKTTTSPILGADGLIFHKNELIVISNSSRKIIKLISNDNWISAKNVGELNSEMTFPTTGTRVNGKYYVLNAKLNEIFTPNTKLTSDFLIQEVTFDKK